TAAHARRRGGRGGLLRGGERGGAGGHVGQEPRDRRRRPERGTVLDARVRRWRARRGLERARSGESGAEQEESEEARSGTHWFWALAPREATPAVKSTRVVPERNSLDLN